MANGQWESHGGCCVFKFKKLQKCGWMGIKDLGCLHLNLAMFTPGSAVEERRGRGGAGIRIYIYMRIYHGMPWDLPASSFALPFPRRLQCCNMLRSPADLNASEIWYE